MDLIFLDIDGVLNTGRWLKYLGSTLGYDKLTDVDDNHKFDPECVNNLRIHIEKYKTKIVISSTWRYQGLDFLKELWKNRNLPGEIIGITPAGSCQESGLYTSSSRGDEIQQYLDKNNFDRYAIIDDDNDMLDSQKEYFVKTDFETGLNAESLERLNKIFS